MISPQRPASFRKASFLAASAALVLVVGGTLFALKDTGALASFEDFIRGDARISLKVDHSTLPADGVAQTKITVLTDRASVDVSASIASGTGRLDPHPDDPKKTFVYTAGTEPGSTQILVEAGSFESTAIITLVPAGQPKQTMIVAPPDGSTTNNPRPEVAGTAPANATILLTTNGAENTTTRSDDQGVFKVTLEKPLYNGQHTISASVINELNQSTQTSNLVTITVQADPVKVDSENIRTSPSRLIANSSFGLFIPASLNTDRVVVELEERTFELHNAHDSTVFSGVLPTPPEAGVYFGNLVLYDIGGNPTRFDRLLRFSVASS